MFFFLRNPSAQHTEDTSVKYRYVFYFSDRRFRLTTADSVLGFRESVLGFT